MFPVRDSIKLREIPYATNTLIAINALVFLAECAMPSHTLEAVIQANALVPASLFTNSITGFRTIFTSMFLHLGWGHLFGNMWFLWLFGKATENKMGHSAFTILYALSGLCAAAVQVCVDVHSTIPMAGASGAISGVLGAYLYFFPQATVTTILPLCFWARAEIPAMTYLGLWLFMQLWTGLHTTMSAQQPHVEIAFFAHIGGFLGGFMLACLFDRLYQALKVSGLLTTEQ